MLVGIGPDEHWRDLVMTTPTQSEALAVLAELSALSPDIRLGQLRAHLGFLGEAHLDRGLGYMDDDELLGILHRHREELLARLPDSQGSSPIAASASKAS